jgi:endonuclease YncB( thermonuclease family)
MKRITLLLIAFGLAGCAPEGLKDGYYTVRRTLSGDRIELDSGLVVRYAGIIAPVLGDPFYEDARLRNDQFVVGRDIRVELRFLRGRFDREGNPYASVFVPARSLKASVWVNTELLEQGLGRIDFKTVPAGKDYFFEERERRARLAKRGIWSRRR